MLETVTTSLPVKISSHYPLLSYQEAKENWPTAHHDSIISRQITPKKQTMSDRSSPSNRWRLNGNSQDTTAPQWELSDELARLKIGQDGSGDATSLQTPAKPLALTSVQRGDASPSSIASGKSSPRSVDHHPQDSHSRASSIDTGAQDASFSKVLLGKSQASHSLTPEIEHKERPHSFSGGLSAADLRRLQQAGDFIHDTSDNQKQSWSQSRDATEQQASEQLSYPSLTNNGVQRNVAQPQRYEVRVQPRDELQVDYNTQQRNFTPIAPGQQPASPTHQSFSGRPANVGTPPYRQSQRGFASPTQMAYPSLGNGQQLYELMMPGAPHEHPAVARVQQQHNVYPRSHHHTPSDPTIRDPATLALLNGGVQPFAPGMFQPPMGPAPMHVYPNQFFAGQDFTRPDVVAAQTLARLQPQYTGQYGIPQQNMMLDGMTTPPPTNSATGPSANNRKLGLYKTELCRSWEEKGSCRYGAKCQFAHGEDELRSVSRHPKYKTEICRTFWVSGSCPYGKRCCFIHTELPANGNAAAPTNPENTKPGHSRERSSSTNSDPNDASASLLARIRNQEPSAVTPVDNKPSTYQILGRPTISVNTSLGDSTSMKQNKSAFPTFASNVIIPPKDNGSLKSPAPVTAGPDIGRHNNFSYGVPRHKTSSSSSSIRNSYNGEDLEATFSPTPPSTGLNYNAPDSPATAQTPRGPGHTRAGSSGNWGSIGRTSLGASSFPSAAAELPGSSPWSTNDLVVGSTRLHDKTWN